MPLVALVCRSPNIDLLLLFIQSGPFLGLRSVPPSVIEIRSRVLNELQCESASATEYTKCAGVGTVTYTHPDTDD